LAKSIDYSYQCGNPPRSIAITFRIQSPEAMDEAKKLEETVGLNQRALSRRSIAGDRLGGSKYEIPRASMDRACALAF